MCNYIVYNGFWNAVPSDPVRRLAAAAAKRGYEWIPVPNTACVVQTAPTVMVSVNGRPVTDGDKVLFWDKDTRLAFALEGCGARLYNRAAAVAVCDDKSETHRVLALGGVPMPKTLLAPMTYTAITEAVEPFLAAAVRELGFPMVMKECYGSFGRQVYLAQDETQLHRLVYAMGPRAFLLQEFVAASSGDDVRLYVVGDTVSAAIRRHSEADFRANVELGGTATPYAPTPEEMKLAQRCRALLGLDFCAVDLLHDENGDPLVCEVNSNAYMAGLIGATGVDVAEHIVEYVMKEEPSWKN